MIWKADMQLQLWLCILFYWMEVTFIWLIFFMLFGSLLWYKIIVCLMLSNVYCCYCPDLVHDLLLYNLLNLIARLKFLHDMFHFVLCCKPWFGFALSYSIAIWFLLHSFVICDFTQVSHFVNLHCSTVHSPQLWTIPWYNI